MQHLVMMLEIERVLEEWAEVEYVLKDTDPLHTRVAGLNRLERRLREANLDYTRVSEEKMEILVDDEHYLIVTTDGDE